MLNPSFDYIVDALGAENRTAYLAAFRRTQPALVQTIDPRFSRYEEWLEATTWDFYRDLLANYQVVGTGPWSIFWERVSTPTDSTPILARWDGARARRSTFTLKGLARDRVFLLEAELDYRVTNPWRHVPLFGHLPRYVVLMNGVINSVEVPLPPYQTTVRFPIVVAGQDGFSMAVTVASLLPGARVSVSSLRLRSVPVRGSDAIWLSAFIAGASRNVAPSGAPIDTRLRDSEPVRERKQP